jgi:hypothetical protein
MSSSKFCSVCGHGYRSRYSVHASTEAHRRALRPARLERHDLARSLGIRRPSIVRALAGDRGEDQERVKAHRRRPPLDGPRRSVKVRRYWRSRFGHFSLRRMFGG